jgi:hypothetical protein
MQLRIFNWGSLIEDRQLWILRSSNEDPELRTPNWGSLILEDPQVRALKEPHVGLGGCPPKLLDLRSWSFLTTLYSPRHNSGSLCDDLRSWAFTDDNMFLLDKGSAPLREETRAPRATRLDSARPTLTSRLGREVTPLSSVAPLEPNASKVTSQASANHMNNMIRRSYIASQRQTSNSSLVHRRNKKGI